MGRVTWAERVDGVVGVLDTSCQDRGHNVLHSLSLLRNIKVRVGAADWEFTMNLTSNVNFLFPWKQFNTKTKDGFTVNTKVPSLKDQGKEYDGFTITITGDKYVRFLSVGVQRWAGVRKCADAWYCQRRFDILGFCCLLKWRLSRSSVSLEPAFLKLVVRKTFTN